MPHTPEIIWSGHQTSAKEMSPDSIYGDSCGGGIVVAGDLMGDLQSSRSWSHRTRAKRLDMAAWHGGPKVGVVATDKDPFILGTPFHHDQAAGRWRQFGFKSISLLSQLGKVRTGLHSLSMASPPWTGKK